MEPEYFCAAGPVPDPGGAIFAASDQALAIGRKCHRTDITADSWQADEPCAGDNVPNRSVPIMRARGNPPTIRGDGHCPNDAPESVESGEFLPGHRIPYSDGLVATTSCRPLAVRRNIDRV